MSSEAIMLFTDGACSPNPGPGGYGVILVAAGQRREFSGGFRKTTNNRMELFSVIRGLREAQAAGEGPVTVYSDSQYVVSMLNGGHAEQWRQHRWTRNRGKDPALNPDLWGELLDLRAGRDVCFVWVRGHAGHAENVRCDELAVLARQAPNLPADQGYELPQPPAPAAQMTLAGFFP